MVSAVCLHALLDTYTHAVSFLASPGRQSRPDLINLKWSYAVHHIQKSGCERVVTSKREEEREGDTTRYWRPVES